MKKYLTLIFFLSSFSGFTQDQLCAKLDTVVANDDGSLFVRLEGIKRSFYNLSRNKESTLISVIAIAKAHEMKICLEGLESFEEITNRQKFKTVRLH